MMPTMMNRRSLHRLALGLGASTVLALAAPAWAADEAPDALIQRVSADALETLRTDKSFQSGDIPKIVALVDKVVMPHVNFRRMTSSAVGPGWRKATPEQQAHLQQEFKTLLVRTYAGALAQVKDESVTVKPMRAKPGDTDVLVRTEVRGRATRCSSTTAWKRRRARVPAGRSTTSTSWACGWSKPTATSSRRRSTPRASTA